MTVTTFYYVFAPLEALSKCSYWGNYNNFVNYVILLNFKKLRLSFRAQLLSPSSHFPSYILHWCGPFVTTDELVPVLTNQSLTKAHSLH